MEKERILIIVESPNKVKTISQLLKGTKYKDAIVKASVGHISCINNNKNSYYNTGIYPDKKFKADYAVSNDKKDVIKSLKEQTELATTVYICSDPDREGEAIAWSLRKFLNIPKTKYKRATFHEITKQAVLKALDNPRDIDEDLVDASHARQKLDKMIGYRLSPIAQKCINAKSVGRCQSAGLELITSREKEINAFVPKEYGDLNLLFTKNDTQFKAKYFGTLKKEIKQPEYTYCEKVIEDCHKEAQSSNWFRIDDISTKEKISNPKPPFTTSTFQQEVSNKLNINVKTSMQYAQKLFEGININGSHIALITYIRTDSNEFTPEFLPILESYVKKTYGDKYYAPIRKVKKSENAQEGHEAIRPTDLNMTPQLLSKYISDTKLLKVYEIIYKRTVATMMASSITGETTYSVVCGNNKFILTSKELKFDGYLACYNYKDKNDKEDIIKESFKLNEIIDKRYNPSMTLEKKQTQPPSRYKEATFIKELESSGIGRPSTFATIVETILDSSRDYCTLEDGNIVPTSKGMSLSNFLETNFSSLINVSYTSELEKSLDLIAKGKQTETAFLEDFYTNMEKIIDNSTIAFYKSKNESKEKIVSDSLVCPKCGSKMILRKGPYGEFWGCSKYPKCKGIIKK